MLIHMVRIPLIFFLFFACPSKIHASDEGVKPPSSIFGHYIGAPCSKDALDCILTLRSDYVDIVRNSKQAARVVIHISFGHGQLCSLDRPVVWMGDHLLLLDERNSFDIKCALEIHFNGNKINLLDPHNACRDLYCGSRGSFSGAYFSRSK